MDAEDVQAWFAEYHAAVALRNEEEVVDAIREQIERMRAAGYHRRA